MSEQSNNQRAPALCGCKKHGMDLFGDHTSTCTAHSGATKAHDWAVGVLGPLFRSAGHVVRSQHQVTASAGQRRGDVEIREYLRDAAGSREAFEMWREAWFSTGPSPTSAHVQQNGLSRTRRIWMRLCVLPRSARSIALGNNTLTIRAFLFSPPL